MKDQADFLQRFLPAQPSLRAYVLSVVRDFQAVEDILQEVAAAAWSKYDSYDGARPFVAWVLGMARYKCVDFLRSRKLKPLLPDDLSDRLAEDAASIDADAAERRGILAACVEKLTATVRDVVRMRFDLRLDAREIARRQGKSLAAVSKMLSRARAFLVRCAGQPG